MTTALDYDIQADREAEDALIACCLSDDTAPARVLSLVAPGDFFTDPARAAIERIRHLFAEGKPVTVASLVKDQPRPVRDEFGTMAGGELTARWASDILRMNAGLATLPQSVPYWAEYVTRQARTRRMLTATNDVMRFLLEGGDPDEAMVMIEGSLSTGQARRRVRTRAIGEILGDGLYHRIQDWMEDPTKLDGPAMGIPLLDTYLGGCAPGRLITVGADTGVGKSSFVQHLALYLTGQGVPVQVISTEMSDDEVGFRLSFMEAGWDKLQAKKRRGVTTGQKESMLDGLDRLAERPLYLTELHGMSIDMLEADVHRVRELHGVQVVILDLLNGLPVNGGRTDTRAQGIADNTARLKQMAEREAICLIMTAHINRGSATGLSELGLHSFLDSGGIERDSDAALILIPTDPMGERLPRKEAARLINQSQPIDLAILICKNRSGAEGSVPAKLNWAHGGRYYPVDAA